MADDITLTVRVRDMTRGDFNRLDNQLDRMKRNLQGVNRSTDSAGMHSQRLGRDIDALSNRFKSMAQTGNLTRRELGQMRNMLDGMSRSAINAARSGEITTDRYRDLNTEITSLRSQLNHLGRGLDDNTNALRRNGNQTTQTVRMVNGMVRSVNTTTRDINGSTRTINTFTRDVDGASNALRRVGGNSTFAGRAFGQMHAKLIGLAVFFIATLLPTIGALSPMLFGLIAVFGAAALAVNDLKDAAKKLEPEFKKWQETASKAIKPGIEKSIGNLRQAMSRLNPVIKVGGETFATFLEKTSRALANPFFQADLYKNVQMGSRWFLQFAGSMGKFLRAFLDFGTKSQPALDAWQNLLGGFLERGLPKMFAEMEQGIKGSSAWLNGLANTINDDLLPGLGRMLGSFMETFGPLMQAMLEAFGEGFEQLSKAFTVAMEALEPFALVAADALRGVTEVMSILGDVTAALARTLGGALFESLLAVFGMDTSSLEDMSGGFTKISDWVDANSGKIRSAFFDIANAIILMVRTGVSMLPQLWGAFRLLTEGVITSLDGIISGLANTLGNAPGMGWLKDANNAFDEWAKGAREDLDTVGNGIQTFVDESLPRLDRAPIELDVTEAEQNLADIKAKLQDPSLTAERRAKLTAEKEQAEATLAAAKAKLAEWDASRADATLAGDPRAFFGAAAQVSGWSPPLKWVPISGTSSPFWGVANGIIGRVLGSAFINIHGRYMPSAYDNRMGKAFSANGNIFRKSFAAGGVENHIAQIAPAGAMRIWAEPETGGEAYIPLSKQKRPRSRNIAEQTVGILGGRVEWFAKGGLSADAKNARNQIKSDVTVSRFGKMAGWKHAEFITQVGAPDALEDIVRGFSEMRSLIQKAFSGKQEKTLLSQLDVAAKAQLANAKKLFRVNAALDSAREKLDELKQSASQLKDSVKSAIQNDANITQSASGEDSQATINTILAQMTSSAANSQQFATMLEQLKARGLTPTLIAQIAEAGISGGGMETAAAILGGSKADILKLNSLQSDINSAATAAGTTTADSMYGVGIRLTEGIIKGLEASKKSLEKSMMDLAKFIEKALKNALGIKSPSRVTMRIGEMTAEGFALGMENNNRPKSSWESMLSVPSNASRSSYPTGPASGQTLVIQVKISDRDLGEIVIDPLRKSIRHRGGNVQAVLGKGN